MVEALACAPSCVAGGMLMGLLTTKDAAAESFESASSKGDMLACAAPLEAGAELAAVCPRRSTLPGRELAGDEGLIG
jgi:hypothetical protein